MARARSNEPLEWQRGVAEARAARALVAEQLAGLLVERDMTGGREYVAQRLREVLVAETHGDVEVQRAAAMELALAAAGWVVAIDLGQASRVPPAA